jgi:hypothetical protein
VSCEQIVFAHRTELLQINAIRDNYAFSREAGLPYSHECGVTGHSDHVKFFVSTKEITPTPVLNDSLKRRWQVQVRGDILWQKVVRTDNGDIKFPAYAKRSSS